ncbi:MAG: SMC family ATPase [Paludibacteraceae bacterium]|nr:SMC family ATPase [Paludibacteraceae bacterium]
MLKLNKLTLENFGPFKGQHEFKFSDGFNLIKARNGSGKSTVIAAIRLLLLDDYQENLESFINNEHNTFIAKLSFSVDNTHYITELSCKKAGKTVTTNRSVRNDSIELATGEEAKKYLANLINPGLGKYALICTQSLDNSITKCKDAERRELMKKISDLVFDKEIDTLVKPKIESLKDKLNELDKVIFSLENYPYKSYEDRIPLPFDESVFKEKQVEVDKLKAEKLRVDTIVSQIAALRRDISDLEKQMENDRGQINSLTQSISSLNEKMSVKESSIKNSDEHLDNKILQINQQYIEQRAGLDKQISDLESKISTLSEKMGGLQQKEIPVFNEDDLLTARGRLTEVNFSISETEKVLLSLSNGICPTCGGDCKHKTDEYKQKLSSLNQESSNLENRVLQLVKEKKDIENQAEQIRQQNHEFKCLDIELSSTKEKLSLHRKSLENLSEQEEKEISSAKSAMQDYVKQSREMIASWAADIQDKQNYIQQIEAALYSKNTSLMSKQKELSELDTGLTFDKGFQLESLECELQSYTKAVHENEVLGRNKREQDELKQSNETKLAELQTKRQNIVKEQYDLETAKQIMTKDFPNYVLDNYTKDIENSINEFIETVYYKSLYVNLRPTTASVKMEFGKDKKLPISKLSGAENALVSIGFVQHFNRLLNLKSLILDEPDAALDSTTVVDFRNALINLGSIFEQILIVTHDESLQNYLCSCTECNLIQL